MTNNNKKLAWTLAVPLIFLLWTAIASFFWCSDVKGAWIPVDHQTWQNSEDSTKFMMNAGKGPENYQKDDGTWALIENSWSLEGDTTWSCLTSFLKTRVWKDGKTTVEVEYKGTIYGINQSLKALVFANVETNQKFVIDDELNWNNSAMDSNLIGWIGISPGVNYAVEKNTDVLRHRVIYKPAFLDSAVKLYNLRSDSLNIVLANVMLYTLTNVDYPDSALGHIPFRKLKQLGKYFFGLERQRLHCAGVDTFFGEEIPVMQEWYKKDAKLLCAEYVWMSDLKKVHELYPDDPISHHTELSVFVGTNDTYWHLGWCNDAYATCRATVAADQSYTTSDVVRIGQWRDPGMGYIIRRYGGPLDVSEIDDEATIDTASFYMYAVDDMDANSDDYALCWGDFSGILITAEWDEWTNGMDKYVVKIAEGSEGAYWEWGVTQDSCYHISLTDEINFGLRSYEDVDGTAPPSGASKAYEFRTADYTGTDYDPYWTVWYTVGEAEEGQVIIIH